MQYVDFTIIVDTREQHPWELKHYTTASRKLDTGDYSVEGFENILCIERKYSISEFVNNMGEKRFKDVLERMQPYQYSFIIKYNSISSPNCSLCVVHLPTSNIKNQSLPFNVF